MTAVGIAVFVVEIVRYLFELTGRHLNPDSPVVPQGLIDHPLGSIARFPRQLRYEVQNPGSIRINVPRARPVAAALRVSPLQAPGQWMLFVHPRPGPWCAWVLGSMRTSARQAGALTLFSLLGVVPDRPRLPPMER